jgi:hypothetical protein
LLCELALLPWRGVQPAKAARAAISRSRDTNFFITISFDDVLDRTVGRKKM